MSITAKSLCVALVLGSPFLSSVSFGQDPSTIIVPYSSGSNRTLGDAVNIAFPYDPVGRCVIYQATDVKWDTAGAIASEGKISIVAESSEQKRTTNIALGYQTNGKVKAGIFSADSKLDTELTTESFRQDAASTITLQFTANADYGRRMIESYVLDSNAPDPVANLSAFRLKCGTHFIRGERRSSDLTILVRIKTTSQSGKDALSLRLSQTLGGGVSLKAISGEAGSTFTSSYKSIIEYAKKAGQVTVEYRAHGGPGIAAAGTAAKVIDPADFAKLSEIAANVSSLFTQENSSIVGYILQSDTALGAPPATFDSDRMERIGELTRRLMMLSEAGERYSEVRAKFGDIYERYFATYGQQVDVARAELVDLIKACAAGGSCDPPANDILETLHFLEDMFVKAEITLSCQYQPATSLLPIVGTPKKVPNVLESMSINIHGVSHNPAVVDFTSVHVARLTPDIEIEDETDGFSGFAVSKPDKNGESRVFGTVYSENIYPKTALRFDASTGLYSVDTNELQKRRDMILDSAYSVFAPGPNGVKVSYDVGFPPRQGCPVIESP